MKIPFTVWMNILNFKNIKYIYIWFGLVFDSSAHAAVDMHVCSFFFFLYLLICTLDLSVCNIPTRMYQPSSVTEWCGKLFSCPGSTVAFELVLLSYYWWYYLQQFRLFFSGFHRALLQSIAFNSRLNVLNYIKLRG